MYNRYVDGLATWQPEDPQEYREMGERMARVGYVKRDAEVPGGPATAGTG